MTILRKRIFHAIILAALLVSIELRAQDAPLPGEPTTSSASVPATAPATQPVSKVRELFDELASTDGKARDEAFSQMLKLTRPDLVTLQDVVAERKTLALTQSTVLMDIVTHVYLSGETYECFWSQGFLGVRKNDDAPEAVVVRVADDRDPNAPVLPRSGAPIGERVPGFCGYEAFRAGDIVTSLSFKLDRTQRIPADNDAVETMETSRDLETWTTLSLIIMTIPANTEVTFDVLRNGSLIKVPVRLSPRPVSASNLATFMQDVEARTQKAAEYWNEHFAPLVTRTLS
jgi:hypothetical protein